MPQKHDPLYKELIKAFFKEFIQFAVPELDELIDYKTVKFLDKEIHDIFSNEEKRLDLLTEVTVKNKKEIIHIHIEIESKKDIRFNFRMWDYFCQIHRKYKKNVIPIALFVDDHKWKKPIPENYTVAFNNKTYMNFFYHRIKVKNFKVTEYLDSKNPLIQALLVKMDMTNIDAKKIKIEILRFLAGQKSLGAKREILYNYINTYLILSPEKEKEVLEEIKQDSEVQKMVTTFAEKLKKEGLIEGSRDEKLKTISYLKNEIQRIKKLHNSGELSASVLRILIKPINTKLKEIEKSLKS